MRVISRARLVIRTRPGLTLLECMVALTILPLAVVGIALAVIAGQAQAAEAMRITRASLLAESMMEEIVALTYDSSIDASLGPEAGETSRGKYNSPNDFHGFAEEAGKLTDATGVPCPGPMQRFSRSVSCSTTSLSVAGLGQAIDGLQVTVTIKDGEAEVVVLRRFVVDKKK